MHYYFSTDINETSYIVLGDMSGSVIIMTFSPVDRGPFKQHTPHDVTILRYDEVIRVRRTILSQEKYVLNIVQRILLCVIKDAHCVIRANCKGCTSQSTKIYTRIGRVKWLTMEICERSYQAANAPIVPYMSAIWRKRERNILSNSSWGYPASCSAKVPPFCNRAHRSEQF